MFPLTPIVKNLVIINVILYLIPAFFLPVLESSHFVQGINEFIFKDFFGLHYVISEKFFLPQLLTYSFIHDGFEHLFLNMMGLIAFGPILESRLGARKFLILYIGTAVGAALIFSAVRMLDVYPFVTHARDFLAHIPDPDVLRRIYFEFRGSDQAILKFLDAFEKSPQSPIYQKLAVDLANNLVFQRLDRPLLIGASGSVFGLMFAVAYLFPNREMRLLFPPIPIKTVFLVGIFVAFEVYSGFKNMANDNVSHLTHIGGVFVSYLFLRFWKTTPTYN